MKGGGDWEEYCPVCGLPFGEGYGAAQIRLHKYPWMKYALGFETTDKHHIFELENYEYGGEFDIIGKSGNNANGNTNNAMNHFKVLFSWDSPDDAEPFEGIAIHKDCVKSIEKKIGRPLTYADAILIRNKSSQSGHPDLKGYDDQWFDWKKAKVGPERLPEWMFLSPVDNEKALDRILRKLPEEFKEFFPEKARAVHILAEHIQEIPKNLAPIITEFVTGRKAYNYMPERFKKPNSARGGKRKTRRSKRTNRTKRQTRRR